MRSPSVIVGLIVCALSLMVGPAFWFALVAGVALETVLVVAGVAVAALAFSLFLSAVALP
jgi:hypothetical protein